MSDERNGRDTLEDIFITIKWTDVDIKVLFDLITMLNDKNQDLLHEILMQEEYKPISNTDLVKKILRIDYLYIMLNRNWKKNRLFKANLNYY